MTVVLLDCGHYVMSSRTTGNIYDLCFRHGEETPWRKVVHLASIDASTSSDLPSSTGTKGDSS